MRQSKIILIIMVLLSWITLPLIGTRYIKRFLPGALFMSGLIFGESVYARKKRWWIIHKKIHPSVTGETPLILGPFLIGSLWILRFTYGKFFIYLLLNAIANLFFVFPFYSLFNRIGIFSLVRLSRMQLAGLFFIKSVIMYMFQFGYEKVKQKV